MDAEQIKMGIQAVVDGLTPLAQKLQIPIEGIFVWAIKHNYAQAAIGLAEAVTVIPIAYYYVKFMKWGFEKASDEFYGRFAEDGGKTALAIFFSIFVLVITISGIMGIETAISRFIAPEWNASKVIYQLIKGQ